MSEEKFMGMTLEEFEARIMEASKRGGRVPDRIIGVKAHNLLKKIHEIEPEWNSWQFEMEIQLKAMKLGIKYE